MNFEGELIRVKFQGIYLISSQFMEPKIDFSIEIVSPLIMIQRGFV